MENEKDILRLDLMRSKEEVASKEAEITRLKEEAKAKQNPPIHYAVKRGKATATALFTSGPRAVLFGSDVPKKSAIETKDNGSSKQPVPVFRFGASNQQAAATPFVWAPVNKPVTGFSGFGASNQQAAAATNPSTPTSSKQNTPSFGSSAFNQQASAPKNQPNLLKAPAPTGFRFGAQGQTPPGFADLKQGGAVAGSFYEVSNQPANLQGFSSLAARRNPFISAGNQRNVGVSNGAVANESISGYRS